MAATQSEATDPYCLSAQESHALLQGHPWRRFVVLGDSVAEGLCEPVDGYPEVQLADRIAAELRARAPEFAYRNLGLRGLRAYQVRASQLGPALEFAPDLALVVCGGNDAFRPSYDPAAVDAEIAQMVEALQHAGATVITVGMFDVSQSPAIPQVRRAGLGLRLRRLAEHTRAVANRLDTVHVHLTDHPLTADPSIYSSDGRHGSARSDAVAAAETLRRLAHHLGATGTDRSSLR